MVTLPKALNDGSSGTCFSSNPLLRLALVKLKTLTGAASIGFDVLLATAPIPSLFDCDRNDCITLRS